MDSLHCFCLCGYIRQKTFTLTLCLLEEFGSSTISHLFRKRLIHNVFLKWKTPQCYISDMFSKEHNIEKHQNTILAGTANHTLTDISVKPIYRAFLKYQLYSMLFGTVSLLDLAFNFSNLMFTLGESWRCPLTDMPYGGRDTYMLVAAGVWGRRVSFSQFHEWKGYSANGREYGVWGPASHTCTFPDLLPPLGPYLIFRESG